MHGLAIAPVLFLLIWHNPNQIIWWLFCVLYPIFPFIIYRNYKSYIKIAPQKGPYWSVGLVLILPSFAMALTVMDYQYVNSNALYLYSGIFAILMLLLFLGYIIYNYNKGRILIFFDIAILLVAGGLYGYGLSSYVNRIFDNSSEQIYRVRVLNKFHQHVSSGKGNLTLNYLVITPWGPVSQISNVSVPNDTYEILNEGNIAIIKLREGALNIPWYTVSPIGE